MRAELVKVDVIRRNAVYATLRLGEACERGQRLLADRLREVCALDELANLAVPTMRVAGWSPHVDVQRPDPVALDARDDDLHAFEPERLGNRAKPLDIRARVEQRGEEHVARQTAHTVQVRSAAHSRPRAIRAAIVPAPSPSSIPTTARPAAQEESIAFNAV